MSHVHWWDRSPKLPGDMRPYVALRCDCGDLPPGCPEDGSRCPQCDGVGWYESPYAPTALYPWPTIGCEVCNGTGEIRQAVAA